jgi:uncharacterized protein (DUF302 family)
MNAGAQTAPAPAATPAPVTAAPAAAPAAAVPAAATAATPPAASPKAAAPAGAAAAPAMSVEEELKPKPEAGARHISTLSPEAQKVLREKYLKNSARIAAPVPAETKKRTYDSMVGAAPMSMKDMFNFMTLKKKAKAGLKFDEIVEAMDIKANDVNFKKVGVNAFWKDVGALSGLPTTRIEVMNYCDADVGRRMLDFSPEFVIFIPCRVAVYEDYNGDIWLMTLDWDVSWLARAWQSGSQLSKQMQEDAIKIKDALVKIMEAGATGQW